MNDTKHDAGTPFEDLSLRPGFLIRRLHQIHLALFAEECAEFDVTPVQYSLMTAISAEPGLDQVKLALKVGIDRATLAAVLARLELKGLMRRVTSRKDGRLKLASLTVTGQRLLKRIDKSARRAHERTIEALPEAERAAFLKSLRWLVESGNVHSRAPLRLKPAGKGADAAP